MLLLFFFLCVLPGCSRYKGLDQFTAREDDSTSVAQQVAPAFTPDHWVPPDTLSIGSDSQGQLIRYGRDLVARTGKYFGPHGLINHFANGMNCQNCHLGAGTKLFANSYSAVYSIYPKWRARSGTVENLVKRVNDCMERSLNGRKLDSTSREMQAMIAYINWVGKDVPKGITPKGASVVDVPYLDRAADPQKGMVAFNAYCIRCHTEDGQGKFNPDSMTYQYPPLWGAQSYNTGAGMYRLSRLAGFIKSNMPFQEASHDKPKLTDEEAWDIAAYINSQPRPVKKFKADWPDITKKPVDHPFGPYADHFSEQQHKFGPFKEMIAAGQKK
ncbi:MAG TPA: c-type cytochrome [Saprospiraceae bacterium]|nr:c-type cytochrome [Saprospiraceae bacterium]